jgi:hypothetical protein
MTRGLKDILDASPPYLLSVAAALCLALAVYFCFQDKLKAAALLGGLFLLCVLLAYFPQLESVKAFTVEAKLRKSIDRAEEIMERIKQLSIVNAKLSYTILAWQNRFGGASAKEKQAILDEVDRLLSDLKIHYDERNEIIGPYVQLIGVDLHRTFSRIIDAYVKWKKDHLVNTDGYYNLQDFNVEESRWRMDKQIKSLKGFDLDTSLQREISTPLLNPHEKEIANNFRQEILNMYTGCKNKGGLTKDALEFIDYYDSENSLIIERTDRKMRELFSVSQ